MTPVTPSCREPTPSAAECQRSSITVQGVALQREGVEEPDGALCAKDARLSGISSAPFVSVPFVSGTRATHSVEQSSTTEWVHRRAGGRAGCAPCSERSPRCGQHETAARALPSGCGGRGRHLRLNALVCRAASSRPASARTRPDSIADCAFPYGPALELSGGPYTAGDWRSFRAGDGVRTCAFPGPCRVIVYASNSVLYIYATRTGKRSSPVTGSLVQMLPVLGVDRFRLEACRVVPVRVRAWFGSPLSIAGRGFRLGVFGPWFGKNAVLRSKRLHFVTCAVCRPNEIRGFVPGGGCIMSRFGARNVTFSVGKGPRNGPLCYISSLRGYRMLHLFTH